MTSDLFLFRVCTPRWLEQRLEHGPYVLGRGLIVVRAFDWTIVEGVIRDILARIQVESWDEAAEQLSRFGEWEFEGTPPPFPRGE